MATPLTERMRSDGAAVSLRDYESAGGYRGLGKALALPPREVVETVIRSGLRGRGGAGFPTGQKWSFVPAEDDGKPRYLVVNADEKEPGTMKDRLLMERRSPPAHRGARDRGLCHTGEPGLHIPAAGVPEARRGPPPGHGRGRGEGLSRPRSARLRLRARTPPPPEPGRYMCGEETGLLNALEGKRATPRNKPPFPQVSGLWGRPTVVNNVETLCNLPHILREGPEWYKTLSSSPDAGTKLYGVERLGRKRPGIWELPMGATVREILEDRAGGMAEGGRCAASSPAAPPPISSTATTRSSPWTSTPSPRREAGSARAL